MNSVQKGRGRESYHHGALREALIAIAGELLEERGIQGFSLREAARRSGVSPGAPAHHFGDTQGLLTAVAADAFRRFGEALAAADHEAAQERIRRQSIAYLRFAMSERNKFKLMWRIDLIDRADPEYTAAVREATSVLYRLQRDAVPFEPMREGYIDVDTRVARLKNPDLVPAVAAWTMIHGFTMLAIDGVFGEDDESGRSPEAQLVDLLERLEI